MLTYSLVARITGPRGRATAWAREAAQLIRSRIGVTVNVSARLGGPQEIIWICQYDDLPAFQASQARLNADPDYARLLQGARDEGLFDNLSIDTAFWLPI
jgi:hypothetical protein